MPWKNLFFFDFNFDGAVPLILDHKIPVALMSIFILLHFISYRKGNLIEQISKLKLRYWTIIITIILAAIVFLFDGNPEDFIYFRF